MSYPLHCRPSTLKLYVNPASQLHFTEADRRTKLLSLSWILQDAVHTSSTFSVSAKRLLSLHVLLQTSTVFTALGQGGRQPDVSSHHKQLE